MSAAAYRARVIGRADLEYQSAPVYLDEFAIAR